MHASVGWVPAVTFPGAATVEVAGDRVGLVGASFATRLLWRNASLDGVRIVDELGLEGAIGGRVGTAQYGGSAGWLALTGRAHYAIGTSFRARGVGRLVVGLRATGGLLRLGTTTAHHATVPVFARGELVLPRALLAAEVAGLAVLGNRSWSGTLQLTRVRLWGRRSCLVLRRLGPAEFLRLRVERQYIDASARTPTGRRDLDSLDYTSVTVDVGVSF